MNFEADESKAYSAYCQWLFSSDSHYFLLSFTATVPTPNSGDNLLTVWGPPQKIKKI